MWLEWVFVLSLALLVQLIILAVTLNDREMQIGGPLTTNWDVVFITLYVLLALIVVWIIARTVYACSVYCGAGSLAEGEPSSYNTSNDNDELDERGGFGDELANDLGELTAEARARGRNEGVVRLVDAAVDFVLSIIDISIVIVLAHALTVRDQDPADASWTGLFSLIFLRLSITAILIVIGCVQTYALEHALAGGSLMTAAFGGLFCCNSSGKVRNQTRTEVDFAYDKNVQSGVARRRRYETRAQFQDWDCVYICAPRALPNWAVYVRGVLLFFFIPVLILVSALLLVRLDMIDADAIAQLVASENAGVVSSLPTVAVVAASPTRAMQPDTMPSARFLYHNVTDLVNGARYLPAFIASGNFSAQVAAHPSLQWHSSVLPLGIVLAPLFTLLGVLLLQSVCMCGSYALAKPPRASTDWILGGIYVIMLVALITSGAMLAVKVDAHTDLDWNVIFSPLYVAFIIGLVAAGCVLPCCLPASYRLAEQKRRSVSRWGIVVYRRG